MVKDNIKKTCNIKDLIKKTESLSIETAIIELISKDSMFKALSTLQLKKLNQKI